MQYEAMQLLCSFLSVITERKLVKSLPCMPHWFHPIITFKNKRTLMWKRDTKKEETRKLSDLYKTNLKVSYWCYLLLISYHKLLTWSYFLHFNVCFLALGFELLSCSSNDQSRFHYSVLRHILLIRLLYCWFMFMTHKGHILFLFLFWRNEGHILILIYYLLTISATLRIVCAF